MIGFFWLVFAWRSPFPACSAWDFLACVTVVLPCAKFIGGVPPRALGALLDALTNVATTFFVSALIFAFSCSSYSRFQTQHFQWLFQVAIFDQANISSRLPF